MAPLLLIVAWNRPDLWRRWFGGLEEVQVVLDQRQRGEAHEPERRRADRRNPAGIEEELDSSGFAITRG